ncbi:MAG: TonB-dependent receptor, partial [Vicinamibacteraceae bacterium]
GSYDLKASLAGFREHKQTAVAVTAGNPVRVNIALTVGSLTETVQVAADTTLLQTDKADLSTQLSSKEITTLPLNQYRNYQALLNLVPGATPAQFQNAEIDSPGRSLRTWVNGTQPNSNATRIDGAVSVNIWLPHHVGYVQPAETIETVNVSTNSFDAEYGMAGGASASVVTKSGTNEVRGSAFWFGNNDKLNANSYFNNAFSRAKDPLTRNIYGGTVGGPVMHNKLFYFGSFERFADKRGSLANYAVPTARMRTGDFGEVAAAYSTFRLYNPATGGAGGVGRELFPNNTIPASMINPVSRSVLDYFPLPNTAADLNSNQLADDYQQFREVQADRDNYDLKMTWQRNASHSVWGKVSMLDAEVIDNFSLGFDEGSLGDTRVYVVGLGHTWTLSPTLVLDGNFGANIQNQTVTGPDYGDDLGLGLGIRGSNGTDIRQSGLPFFDAGYQIGTTPNWMPLFRKERSYTFSTAVTKVFKSHDVRLGVDVVRHALNHIQAEFGDIGGVRGGFRFNGTVTGVPGYTPQLWNTFGTFLLGLQTYGGKDVQTEEMTGREWQSAIYLRDRWNVSPNLTVSAGLRLENYPLMTRADRGLERLDLSTYEVLIGGVGNTPDDVGIQMKHWYVAPRLGAMYRMGEKAVARVGYGRTINPLPWSRPMRGSFPQDIFFNRTADQFTWLGTLQDGIPAVPIPDLSSGRVPLPRGVFMRTPNPTDVDRGIIQQWNAAYEYRLPGDIAVEVAYVGTRTDGGYADLNVNYGTPGGGNASRQYFAIAGTTAINDWAARTRSRYHGLQIAVNRPLRDGLLLKGAYTYSKSKNMADEDGWVGLTWNSPLMYDQNFALAGFDRPHVAQLGFVYTLPFMATSTSLAGRLAQGWQLNGVLSAYSGTPFSVGGTNTALDCQGCGSILINYNGDSAPTGEAGAAGVPWYPVANFSQPTGANVGGFGNTGRNFFRRPGIWNVDLSVFKTFQVGRWRPEFRLEMANAFNHTTWGAPVTSFTANNFMQFVPQSTVIDGTNQQNTPGPRRIQIGLRTQF